jgi:hypothetical protein
LSRTLGAKQGSLYGNTKANLYWAANGRLR